MPLLEHNITANRHLFPTTIPKAAVLDWDENLPGEIESMKRIDVIVYAFLFHTGSISYINRKINSMADITYNTSSFPSLIHTLSSLVKLNAKHDHPAPVILLGYKERDAEERSLWEMARAIGIHFQRVGERVGSGGVEVEVWIGTVENIKG